MFYKQFYSRSIGTKIVDIKGERFKIVKTLMSIDNKAVMLEYLKYCSPKKGDDIIKKLKLKRLDLIKMNIEGAEIQALRGLKRTIMRFKPKIIVWANHSYNGEITDKKVKALLKGLNYNLKTTKDLIVIAEPKK